jgi:glycosyltransferase involved in cell wall biosynthesis
MPRLKILFVSSLFPPDVLGGAESSAALIAAHLATRGYECAVLTTAKAPDQVVNGEMRGSLRIWRVLMPRIYAHFGFADAPAWKKPIWHLQDHFDPRNKRIVRKVLEEFRPDFVHIHMLQGIGYNALDEFIVRNVPTVYVLHDLGLACIRMSMFREGSDCAGQCAFCKVSCFYKSRLVRRFRRIGFCSPSRSNLANLAKVFPLEGIPRVSILNANSYPPPSEARRKSALVRILYVGRLHVSKGVHLLMAAASLLAARYRFSVTIAGSGPAERELRGLYAEASWCRFTGFIAQEAISNLMVNSDVMCVPSIWMENSPGVIAHALTLGLPVIGSNKGGIPELIRDGVTGLLVEPGNLSAWARALSVVLEEPHVLEGWRENALEGAFEFEQSHLGTKLLEFMHTIA